MSRKPKKLATPRKERINEELRELIEVLDEHRLETNASGWFTVPWRDGWNACALALACFERNLDEYASASETTIHRWMKTAILGHEPRAEDYWTAGELLTGIDTAEVSPYLYAALRCMQVWNSHSSGGGEVYNYVLKRAFDKIDPAHLVEDVVLEYRCRDAIGTTAEMQGDANDRTRRAFIIAWRRGLFHAAYSLAPISRKVQLQ